MGDKNPMFGKNFSKEHRIKIGEALTGIKNPLWKGDIAGYRAIHTWIERRLGRPKKCEICGIDKLTGRQIHWSNISHFYKREENDWIRLCVKCHSNYDRANGRRIKN